MSEVPLWWKTLAGEKYGRNTADGNPEHMKDWVVGTANGLKHEVQVP